MSARILCPIDFSESARDAMHAATELARERRASLELVHVAEEPLWTNEPFVHFPGDLRKAARDVGTRELESWRRDAEQRLGRTVTAQAASGAPWERIVAIANGDPDVELIVMGTHGRTGVARALIGSVAERVVRHAPCSVLVVRPRRDRGESVR